MHGPSETTDWLLVRAGLLYDGTSGPRRDVDVLVRGAEIVEVGPRGSLRLPDVPMLELDASSDTVVPGLIDCHLHVSYSGHVGMQQLEWPNTLEFAAVCAGANAARALACGYTSALDVGSRGGTAVATRQAIATGTIQGPDLRVSGQIISSVGGPLDLWPASMRLDPPTRLVALVSGEDEIRRTIRRQAGEGVDNVKIQISGSVVQGQQRGRASVFSDAELRAATGMAHDLGLSVAAHAEGPEAISAAIGAGVDTIQHASFIDDATIDLLERRPASRLVFTLGVYDDIVHIGPQIGYPPTGSEQVAAVWDRMVTAVRLAYDRGVPFGVGSDSGGKVHPHGRYAREVVLLVRACGLPVDHAIRAATRHAAEAGWMTDVGTVEAGKRADLAIVRGDLSERIELLDDQAGIWAVVQRGRMVKGAATLRAPHHQA